MTQISNELNDEEAREYAISAALEVVNAIRTTLGPKGLDKMLVDRNGNVVVTNDGVTILQEMAIDNPIGKMLRSVAETQVSRGGDGTTTAVVLAGMLLDRSRSLFEDGHHPNTIIEGFQLAGELVDIEIDQLARSTDLGDTETYRKVARTSLAGKAFDAVDSALLVDLAVDAIDMVTVDGRTDLDNIYVKREVGRPASRSKVLNGTVVNNNPSYHAMPTVFDSASVMLVGNQLGIEDHSGETPTATSGPEEDNEGISAIVDSPDQYQQFLDHENEQIDRMTELILETGTDVVFYPFAIDNRLSKRLAKEEVLAVEASKHDLSYLKTTTGATILQDLEDATEEKLGQGSVTRDRDLFHVIGEDASRATLLLYASNKGLVDEMYRTVTDATEAIARIADDQRVVVGGGAIEAELARRLRIHADSIPDRKQMAVYSFADALESIPRGIASNAGLNAMDQIIALRKQHNDDELAAGIDVNTGEVADMEAQGVIEPALVKTIAIRSSTDAACDVLHIDSVIPTDDYFTYSEDEEIEPAAIDT